MPHRVFPLNRRQFLRHGVLAGTAIAFVPAAVLGRAGQPGPNSKLNLGFVGVGGRGRDDLESLSSENVVALCDVDLKRAGDAQQKHPKARFFRDYRQMLDQAGKELDAVVVATPDHTHAVVLMAAMSLGKHVYSEKPLAHSLFEARTLTETAQRRRLFTQLGNQGHSSESIREFVELVRAGGIGTVREVHAWVSNSYKPRGYTLAPTETPPVPPTLDWNLWLGPAADRPYSPAYLPGSWRGWVPFGTGILGDWTCHVLDPVFWALELGSPTSVLARCTGYDDPKVRAQTYPQTSEITFKFPAGGDRPPVTVRWFDGQLAPRPAELEPQRKLPPIGAIVIGDQGKIMYGSHGAGGWQIIPKEKNEATPRPPKTIPRVRGHHEDWVDSLKAGRPAGSNFSYGGPLTEIALLGVLAMRCNGHELAWDAPGLKITNYAEANQFINPPSRDGWSL